MNKTIAAAEANRHFSRILREVGQGDSFVITSHGRPVARIVPADQPERDTKRDAFLKRLREEPTMNGAAWTRDELYE